MTATTNGVADRYDFWAGNKALISNANKEIAESVVTDVEVGYLDGVTSNIQSQLLYKQRIPWVTGGLSVAGNTHLFLGSYVCPGTTLSSFEGTLTVRACEMGVEGGEIRFAIDLRRNSSSFPSGTIVAGFADTGCRVEPDDLTFITTVAANASNMVVSVYIRLDAVPSYEFYSCTMESSDADGAGIFVPSISGTFVSGLPTYTWSLVSSSRLAGTGNRLAQVNSLGQFTATINTPTTYIQTLFDDANATDARTTLGAMAMLDTRISDDVNNAGVYNRITDVASAALNNPGSSTSYLLNIRNNAAPTTYQGQLAVTAGSTTYGLAVRNNYNGVWTAWKYALLDLDNPDLVAIEALAGTSGLLRKTAANTWALDTATYLAGSGTQNYLTMFDASGNLVDSFMYQSGSSLATAVAITHDSANTTDNVFICKVTSEANARFLMTNAGIMNWGPGASTRDTNLYRGAANYLVTDDTLKAAGGFRTTDYQSTMFTGEGPGLEMHYDTSNTRARVLAFDRTTSARIPLAIDGSPINFYANGTLKGSFDATGNFNLVNATASRVAVFDSSKNLVSSSLITTGELDALDGVTSSIQTQLNARMVTASYPDLTAIEALAGTSGFLKKTATNTWSLDTNTYLTGNQTITLSGVVTGSGTTGITTAIADNALSIAKTSGLQSALDAKAPLTDVNKGTTFEGSTDPFVGTNRGTFTVNGGVRTWNGSGPFGGAYYNVVDCRHRNNWGSPTDVYGGELAWGMTNYQNKLAFRSRGANGTPGSWYEVGVIGQDVSFDAVRTTNNGNGTNFKVGDDVWIGDINIGNTMSVRGVGDATVGYIRFGNDGNSFGYNGADLVYASSRVLTATTFSADNTWTGSSNVFEQYVTIQQSLSIWGTLNVNYMELGTATATTNGTLTYQYLTRISGSSDLTLTLPTPSVGRVMKIAVSSSGAQGHRIYPATGHVIYWSGMYGTSYNTFDAQPSGVPSGSACLLKPGVYEFIGVGTSEWVLTSGPKTYS